MKKAKFYYNSEACRYEPIRLQSRKVLARIAAWSCAVLLGAIALNGTYYATYAKYTEEIALKKENQSLKLYYELLQRDIVQLQQHIDELQVRDDEIYRTIFEADPIGNNIRKAGVGGRERFADLLAEGLQAEQLVLDALTRVDQMKKQVGIQAKSYEALLTMARNKDKMHASLPAIQPISNKELYRLSSGFGMRIDPIYKIRKKHTGIDFSSPKGTPVYATGAGIVREVSYKRGYGNMVRVDHGYGYETLYAHLSKFNTKAGASVKRGDCIGAVGNTGKSTSPHLHYEVHHKKKKLNPIHFFFQDITQEEFAELLKRASVENQSLE